MHTDGSCSIQKFQGNIWKMYELGQIPSTVFEDQITLESYLKDAMKDQTTFGRRFLKVFVGHGISRETIEDMRILCCGAVLRCEVFNPIEGHPYVQAMVDFGWAHENIILPENVRSQEMALSRSLQETPRKPLRDLPEGYSFSLHKKTRDGVWWTEEDVQSALAIYQVAFPNYVEGQYTAHSVVSQFGKNWNVLVRNELGQIVAIASADIFRMTNEHGCHCNTADITEVAVSLSEKGKGLAHFMYSVLLDELYEERFDLVITECRAIAPIQLAAIACGMKYRGRLTAHIQCQSPVGDQHDACKYEDLYVYSVCLSR